MSSLETLPNGLQVVTPVPTGVGGQALNTNFAACDDHLGDTSNPHDVTAAQVGAVPYSGASGNVDIGSHDLRASSVLIDTSTATARLTVHGNGEDIAHFSNDNPLVARININTNGGHNTGMKFSVSNVKKWTFAVYKPTGTNHSFTFYNEQSGLADAFFINGDTNNLSVGAGTSPSARLHVIKTTEQMRIGYDTSNYYKTTVGSTGVVTLDAVGSGAAFVFSGTIQAPAYKSSDGSTGATGTFTSADGKTITVKDGLITSIV